MKEAFDKEFDSLLRRHARGAGVVGASEARATPEASHLDADELSAFAEGSLPAPARVAAVSHLAECERCRGIVVAVARASGFELAPEKGAAAAVAAADAAAREAPSPAGWGAWLSALFAPRVLRYAVPVLALCAVGVVSFVALRSSREKMGQNASAPSSQVASDAGRRVETQSNASSAAVPEGSPAAANANSDGLVARSAGEAPRGSITAEVPAPVTASPGQGGGGAAGGGAAASAPTASGAAMDQPAAPPPPAERTETASEAPPASKAGPAEERESNKKSAGTDTKADEDKEKRAAAEPTDVANTNDQYLQNRAQSRANETQMQTQSPDGSRNRAASKEQPGFRGGSLAGAAPAPKTEDRDSVASRRARKPASEARKDESEGERGRADDEIAPNAEARSAAGHRFVRKDGAWYDVNYKPAMPSTGVRRGTEGFRALVADLPEVGRAAEQLSGEFFIVIRGRAYHVR
ncbi:MAG TPA: hypothetical protein VJ866_11945 [Pyrinomonadaceae bacterium]|nr:hypothetical protein [Pyrinomonadaceae bacterium]